VRGGIVDLFAPGMADPVRLDFFGDTLESIRSFDPETQRTTSDQRALDLVPVAEFQLTSDTIRLFRTGYVAEFGAAAPDDALYEAVSEGRKHAGMEHWLPLFHRRLETLFDFLGAPIPHPGVPATQASRGAPNPPPQAEEGREGATPILLEPLAEEAAHERLAQIDDYYQARKDALGKDGGGAPYKPLPPDRLYLAENEWRQRLDASPLAKLTPFATPPCDLRPPTSPFQGEVLPAMRMSSPSTPMPDAISRVNAPPPAPMYSKPWSSMSVRCNQPASTQ
jgi:transcription-repair coupling factor (superfamily II helicase)